MTDSREDDVSVRPADGVPQLSVRTLRERDITIPRLEPKWLRRVQDWFIEERPGANTQGATLEEARANLHEAVMLVLEANRERAQEAARRNRRDSVERVPADCRAGAIRSRLRGARRGPPASRGASRVLRILLDENFPLALYRSLQSDGEQVEHIITLGRRGAPDQQTEKYSPTAAATPLEIAPRDRTTSLK